MIQVPGCRLLIKPIKIEEHDKAFAAAKAMGLELPDQTKRQMQTVIDKGIVLQIGPNASQDYIQGVAEGDMIGFSKFGGKFVKDLNSDEDLLIINDEDVVCVFKETK